MTTFDVMLLTQLPSIRSTLTRLQSTPLLSESEETERDVRRRAGNILARWAARKSERERKEKERVRNELEKGKKEEGEDADGLYEDAHEDETEPEGASV